MRWFKKGPDPPITVEIAAHGMAEEHLYIDIMRCHKCGRGPMKPQEHRFPTTWIVSCASCRQVHEVVSDAALIMTDEYRRVLESNDQIRIQRYQRRYSHTDESSNIIDLTIWIRVIVWLLSTMEELVERGEKQSAGYVSTEFNLVQSLREALKFYSMAKDLPPRDAFFTDESYAEYWNNQDAFSKPYLLSILEKQRPVEQIEDDLDRFIEQEQQ